MQSNPQVHGGPQGLYQAYRKMYEALGVSNIDAILPMPPQPAPMNAAMENKMALTGGVLQAFPQQDHKAHMETHLAIMSTPSVQMNPQALALQGHIQEHIGLLAEQQAQQMVMEEAGPEVQQNPEAMQMLQPAIERQAAMLIADMTEQYAQTVEPQEIQILLLLYVSKNCSLKLLIWIESLKSLTQNKKWKQLKMLLILNLQSAEYNFKKKHLLIRQGWQKIEYKLNGILPP